MNTIILVLAVESARKISSFIGEMLEKVLPKTDKKILNFILMLLGKLLGLGGFLLYIYFAGYYIMDKEANLVIATVIALVPLILIFGYKLLTKAARIEAA